MTLTSEQKAIISSKGDLIVNAVAGSGKTSTIIEYVRARSSAAKILYIVFNKSARQDAERRFKKEGLDHVQVETAHSLAFKSIVPKAGYEVKNGYAPNEVVPIILGNTNESEIHTLILAKHVIRFLAYYCNSACDKVKDLNYFDVVSESKEQSFVSKNYKEIEYGTRVMLAKMDKAEIPVTHDFYLKKFQLSQPNLDFDYILFDEGQDASGAMLEVFKSQTAVKVIVGDTHQQIYSWRFAVNSLEKLNFNKLSLSASFRFNQEIADLAMKVIESKEILGVPATISINGRGKSDQRLTTAVIARTNFELLVQAMRCLSEKKGLNKVYFEGNLKSYAFLEDGLSVYDVLNLKRKRFKRIRSKLLRKMKSVEELKDYADNSGESQIKMMISFVEEYGDQIPLLIGKLKEMQVEEVNKHTADIIFTTAHKSKGMEYDQVILAPDFKPISRLIDQAGQGEMLPYSHDRLSEEINLLYVAITRAKSSIEIPEELLPKGFLPISSVRSIRSVRSTSNSFAQASVTSAGLKAENAGFKKTRARKWDNKNNQRLIELYKAGKSIKELAYEFSCSQKTIKSACTRLSLFELYGRR